jgi:hypothetical protein
MIPLIGHLENGNILLLSALDRGHTKSGRRHNWNSGTAGVQVAALGLRRNSGQVTEWMAMKRVGMCHFFSRDGFRCKHDRTVCGRRTTNSFLRCCFRVTGSLMKLAKAPCHMICTVSISSILAGTVDSMIRLIQTFDLSRRIVGIKLASLYFHRSGIVFIDR